MFGLSRVATVASALFALLGSAGGTASAVTALPAPALGVYAGPASKGVAGAAAFGTFAGVAPKAILDFSATNSWANLTAPRWLIAPYASTSARFELSLPMFPDGSQYSLHACATGAYDGQWRTTATNLVAGHLASATVRPGWEFNGTWYHWSAKNDIAGFVGCFRHIVTTMRRVAGQHFTFDWNPNLGANAFPAEQAYPGDAYVDTVGVDAYDMSWSHYLPGRVPSAASQAAAWNDTLNGNHGLTFWRAFAATHHKSLGLTEWGETWRSDGHGGGDDPGYIDHMFDFMANPASHVAYGHYFEVGSASVDHLLTGVHFPAAAAEYRRRAFALG